MADVSHDEMMERVLDLLADICEDDEVREHPDEDLFELGFLDSMGAIELLLGIEEATGVTIAPTEVAREDMNTAELIAQQIEKRI